MLEEQLHMRVYDNYGCDTEINILSDTSDGFAIAHVDGYCSTVNSDMVYLNTLIDILATFLRGFLILFFTLYLLYIRDLILENNNQSQSSQQ